MKLIVFCIFTIIASVITCFFYFSPESHKLRCDSEILYTVNIAGEPATVDATGSFLMFKNGKGFMNLYGSLSQQDKSWLINRKIWFLWNYVREDNFYDVTISHVESKPNLDHAPDELMSLFYAQKFNLEIFHIGKDKASYYMKGISTPYFICHAR